MCPSCRLISVEPCVWRRCSLLLVSVSPMASLSVPCMCLPLVPVTRRPRWTHVSCSALASSPWGSLAARASWTAGRSWTASLQNICALGLSQHRIHLLWETPLTSPSGEPPPCPDPTLRTPYTELSISHVPQDHRVPHSPSLHRRFPLCRIRRVGWFLSVSQIQITCHGRAVIGRGTAEFRGP